LLREAACQERVEIANYGAEALELELAFEFGADYPDIFEVRGYERGLRGEDLPAKFTASEALLGYRGLDGVTRRTRIAWSLEPASLADGRAIFRIPLEPRSRVEFEALISCEVEARRVESVDFAEAWRRAQASID